MKLKHVAFQLALAGLPVSALEAQVAGPAGEAGRAADEREAEAPGWEADREPPPQAPADANGAIWVWGRAENQLGIAQSASEGKVGYADFSTRPLSRVGELVEVIPGAIATQHSGTGKANQYFLRGFNLDHGTDFAIWSDGVPVNFRTHAHGQGYLDINFMIPELVEFVAYDKGPYAVGAGDFSAAATARFKTYDSLARDVAEVSVGSDDYYRLILAHSSDIGPAQLLVGGEAQSYDGPWELEEDLEKFNGLVKLTGETSGTMLRLLGTAYSASWNATDQVPRRAVEQGLIGRFGFIDPDLGGKTRRFSLSATAESDSFEASAYALRYAFNLFSNFTYFLDDPVNGDEFEQADRRSVFGGALRYKHPFQIGALRVVGKVGSEFRYDDISQAGLYRTAGRQRLTAVRADRVGEGSVAGTFALDFDWGDRLRGSGGFRIDHYWFDVEALQSENSGSGSDTIVSPKASLAYRADTRTELYLNYGHSFHSNDVRGATISRDPVTGLPADPVDVLVRARGAEVGVRRSTDAFTVTLAGFWLTLDGELVFVGDAGTTEPNAGSERFGAEFAAFWRPVDMLALDVSLAATRSRYRGVPDSQARIPGSIPFVAGAGATLLLDTALTATVRLRHFSGAPLIEDNGVRSDAATLVNAGLSYRFGAAELRLEILNLLNARENDINYVFESRLPGEADPVEDLHFHPVEPRGVRAALRISF